MVYNNMSKKDNILAKIEKFPEGSVVYFVHKIYGKQWYVEPALVEDWYSDCIVISPLVVKNKVYIDGKPVSDMSIPTRFKKLPKNWSYDTRCCKIEQRTVGDIEYLQSVLINDPEKILEAYDKGFLTTPDKTEYAADYREEVTKEGWRVNREYCAYLENGEFSRLGTIKKQYHEVFKTFKEAQKVIDDYEAELNRQSNLSDYDWAVEEIDKALMKLKRLFNFSDDAIEKMRIELLAIEHLEDVEIKVGHRCIEWKYDKNKRWNTLIP